MNVLSKSSQLRARTISIPDPGPLEKFLTASNSTAFIRDGRGVIGLGEIARFETDSLDAADLWWQEFVENIENESEMPGSYGTGPIAFGTFAFDPDHTKFPSLLIVPEIVIGRQNGIAWITKLGWDNPSLDFPELAEPAVAPLNPTVKNGSTSQTDWKAKAQSLISLIKTGQLDKVVLARDLFVTADQPIDHRWIVNQLIDEYPQCWTYSVDGFVGSCPEMLVKKEGLLVTSRVLAGTYRNPSHKNPPSEPTQTFQLETQLKRGLPVELAECAVNLLGSAKDRLEHEFAADSVGQAMQLYCSAVHVPDTPFVLALPNVLHLATDITGAILPDHSCLAVAAGLHPTAAVCGTPMHLARETIAQFEGFDRGRYAGPVGWIDAQGDGEWVIGLRGGQICPDDPSSIQIFAGCGLVSGSQPDEELTETELKFSPMLSALGLS